MKTQEIILSLLEPNERDRFLSKQKKQLEHERFQSELDDFLIHVWTPFLDDLLEQFRNVGRHAEVRQNFIGNMLPDFYMCMPDKSALLYRMTIKQMEDRFQVNNFLLVGRPNFGQTDLKKKVVPFKSETITTLSGITREDLMGDFMKQYRIEVLDKRQCESE